MYKSNTFTWISGRKIFSDLSIESIPFFMSLPSKWHKELFLVPLIQYAFRFKNSYIAYNFIQSFFVINSHKIN